MTALALLKYNICLLHVVSSNSWLNFQKTRRNSLAITSRLNLFTLQKCSIGKRDLAQGTLVHVLLSRYRIPARFYARYRRIDADAPVVRRRRRWNKASPFRTRPFLTDRSLNAGPRGVQKIQLHDWRAPRYVVRTYACVDISMARCIRAVT